ncbi:complement factor H-related protein 3 isoform X2 [Alligator mississippiensis]|uniref:complement factor H-related protein 3 isoform X2 n=1 Tax=Alligator mississippiensis TaxID=8496 RepID=UPI0028774B83|nr:complement factor H-related protein 3 isoform X2 [Alligator mississippiensis]
MTLLRYMVIQILWAYSSQAEVPVCEHPPEVDFGDILSGEKSEYVESDRVQYCCYPGYTLAGSEWITCNGGSWTQLPKCLAPCTITKQQLEEKNLFLRNNRRRTVIVLSAQTVEFSCSKDYNLTVPAVRTCVDGNIHFPLCIPQTGKKCGRPPAIDNGDITMFSQKDYASGSSVEYKCQHFYTLDGQNTSFCNNGNWTTPPVCVEPCAVSVTEMESHDIELSKRSKGKQYIPHGDFVEFKCKLGYAPPALLSTSDFTVQCYSGNISYPQCHKEITCTPPTILNGGVMVPWRLYKENEQIQFNCDIGFKFNERSDAVCTEDGWRPAPLCIEVTCDPPKVADGSFVPSKTIYREEDVITVDCKRGFHFDSFSGNTAQCTKNGWIPVPKCVLRPCDYPQVENIELSGYYQSNREQAFPAKIGSSTYYRCANGYVTATEENWVLIRCTRDGWDPAPKCIKLCSVPDLENGGTGYWHWKKFKEGETISYSCHRGYIPENQQDRIMCAKDGWSPTPRCISELTCPVDNLENGRFHLSFGKTYHLNDRITYSCNSENDRENQQRTVTCTKNGWWPTPRCIPGRTSG